MTPATLKTELLGHVTGRADPSPTSDQLMDLIYNNRDILAETYFRYIRGIYLIWDPRMSGTHEQ